VAVGDRLQTNVMENVKGIIVKQFPLLKRMRKICDLIHFEFPILSHYRTDTGDNYLQLWCDHDANTERWLLFAAGMESLRDYQSGQITLRSLVDAPRDGLIYVVDYSVSDSDSVTHVVLPADLPPSYLPDAASVYEFERIAETADALEKWLGENSGEENAEWPVHIKADEDGANKLTALLNDLKEALKPYRNP
jgi:hypothetical protein